MVECGRGDTTTRDTTSDDSIAFDVNASDGATADFDGSDTTDATSPMDRYEADSQELLGGQGEVEPLFTKGFQSTQNYLG